MILIDANILLYAHHPAFDQHEPARRWLDAQLNGPTRVGLPWASLLAFVRISASPRILERPLSVMQAWRQVEDWLALEPVWTPTPTDRHRAILAALMPHCATASALVADAHLAALAIEHGIEVCTVDADFSRFPGLRWRNPLGA
jgi:hypothetical protein